MAGGLFGRPFVFNEKCIIFSLYCMALFLYNPNFSKKETLYLSLFILFIISYVGMAWYDFYFNCDILPLKRGSYSLTGLLKPSAKSSEQTKQTNQTNQTTTKRRDQLIYLLHLLIIVPLLGYVSIYRQNIHSHIYSFIGALTIFTAGYHGGMMITSVH